MILRKPYAFFIKYFRWFHVAIAILSAFLILKTIKMVSFFSDYAKTSQLINEFDIGSYINIYTFLLVFLVIVFNVILLSVMIVKKKPFVQYIYNLVTYAETIIVYGFAFSALRTVSSQILEITTVTLIRDFLTISMLLQIGVFITAVIRSTGFDIKKFDFGEDLEKLDIRTEDNEEFEVDVEFNKNVVERSFRSKLRHAKYAIIENKFFVTVASVIIVLFAGLLIYFNVGIYTMNVKEGTPFAASGVGMVVKSSYVTNKDYKLNELSDDKALVILRIEVKANNKITEKLNTGLANLRIKNYSFGPTTKYISSIKDLGNIYFDQALDGDYKPYILVYEIPKGLMKDKMELKFNDTVSFVKGEVGAKSIYVKLKPINLDKVKENSTQKIGETLNLKDSVLGQTTLKIDSYQIADKFKVSYNYCYTAAKCVKSVEYINPTASSNYDKVIMKLEGTFKRDSSINVSKMNDLFDFINSFGYLTYVIDGKTYTHPTTLRKVTPQRAKLEDTYYIEVVPDVAKATSIYFDFKVRNEEYKYILK